MSRTGSNPKRLGYPLLHNCQQFSNAFLRVRRVDEIEIAALDRSELRHLALVDTVRVDNDAALRGLAEDLGQAHDGHRQPMR